MRARRGHSWIVAAACTVACSWLSACAFFEASDTACRPGDSACRTPADSDKGKAGSSGAGSSKRDAAAGDGGMLDGGDAMVADDAGDPPADAGRDAALDAGPCAGKCAGKKPVCDEDAGACVQCLDSETDCTGGKVCSGKHTCVQCTEDLHCPKATASACGADNTCGPCAHDSECEHIDGKAVCDKGVCVQCTGAKHAACMDSGIAYVCDSAARVCSTTATENSVGLCDACISDAQCFAGQLCVDQLFGSPALSTGHYCFWKKAATEGNGPAGNCNHVRPFAGVQLAQKSIDGTTSDLCTLALSTCPAYLDYRNASCESTTTPGTGDDTLCGFDHPSTPDAYCRQDGSSNYVCTLPCGSNDDCKSGFTCDTNVVPNVCTL